MPDTNPSANMNMPIPVVGTDPGPDWANNLNACLLILDQHNHTPGYGVPIVSDAININSDLTFNQFNLTLAKSLRFYPQLSPLSDPTDIGCLYESGVDLYYNDGNGNQVRITQSGGVAGSPGSIANLTSPASATYVSATPAFVWQSAANTPANLDAGSVVFRNISANSFGCTVSCPAALGANYSLVLPSLPASQKIMTLDASGNMSAPYVVDNSTIEINSNTIRVKAGGIGTTQLADGAVTPAKMAALGQQLSSSSSTFSTASATFVDVTNLTVTITTTGRPVFIAMIPDGSANTAFLGGATTGAGSTQMSFKILRDATAIAITQFTGNSNAQSSNNSGVGPFTVDVVAAGTYTYKVQALLTSGSVGDGFVLYWKLIAFEL